MSTEKRQDLANRLLSEARKLHVSARAQYLAEHCPDPALRAEIARTLEADQTMTFASVEMLSAGMKVGHYRIVRPLGAGGMGLVYEALDEKLQRTVAIKVLPPGVVDEEARRRFLREAEAASALNHPNIVTVYEVGADGATDYIVMECIAGRTLRQMIGEKGMDPRTALGYAIQITDALAAAHDAGIVHRDLKPGNLMVTDREVVKVLDFGLAKQITRMPREESGDLTVAGRVVGTFSYMSPEQAQGFPVDGRSDIFAFGAVLYEMLMGVKAFHEESTIATLAAVLSREPAPMRENAPEPLQRVIAKCLQKKPHDRWQHMLDVKLVLHDVLRDLDAPAGARAPARKSFGWWRMAAAAAMGALAATAVFFLTRPGAPKPEPEPQYRLLTTDPGLNDYPAISNDGKFVAFASDRGEAGNLDIWLQQLGGGEPIRLTKDPADELDPAFSPDGTKIAFRSEKDGGGIYVEPALGGEPVLLAPRGHNPKFSPDGRFVAYWTGRGEGSFSAGSRVYVVDLAGGQPRQVHPEMGTALYPVWSPRGDELLVMGWKDPGDKVEWWVLPIERGAPLNTGVMELMRSKKLFLPRLGLRVEQNGLEWKDNRVLFAAPLGDSVNLWEIGLNPDASLGPLRRVTRGPGRHAHAAWAKAGDVERTVFSDEQLNYDVWTMSTDPARKDAKRATGDTGVEWMPSIANDDNHLLHMARRSGTWLLVLRDLSAGTERTILTSSSLIPNARISGDGTRVVYSNYQFDLLSVPALGGVVEKLCDHCGTVMGVSTDGSEVTYEPVTDEDLMMFDRREKRKVTLARRPKPGIVLSGTQLSHDGKWVAFHSVEHPTDTTQVWIARVDRANPVPAPEWIPVTDGKTFAQDPAWSADGNIVYFTSERDGFRCFWGQRLDAASKHPVGEPFPLRHFHSARQSLRGASSTGYLTEVSVGRNRIVFAVGELTGNIWTQETAREN